MHPMPVNSNLGPGFLISSTNVTFARADRL